MSKSRTNIWSSRELELADAVSPGPVIDAKFFNSKLSDSQRRNILQQQQVRNNRNERIDDDSSADAVIQNVQEERMDRVWETPGQAAVRTLVLTFESRVNSRRKKATAISSKVTNTRTRYWKHNNNEATGSTVTTTTSSLPANVAVVIGKSVTIPQKIKASKARAERKRQSFLAEACLFRHVSELNRLNVTVPEVYFSLAESRTFVFIMEDLRRKFPKQHSAFTKKHAQVALSWLARFHAAFWEGRISSSFEGTWAEGSFWNLCKKPIEDKNRENIRDNWQTSIRDLNLPTRYHCLCDNLLSKAEWLDERLSSEPTKDHEDSERPTKRAKTICGNSKSFRNNGKHRTMLHGDFKAENILFDRGDKNCAVVDFQWSGSGYGAKDVMYLLGSASCDKIRRDAWMELLRFYYDQLEQEVTKVMMMESTNDEPWTWDYTWDNFFEHFQLALCDFVRFCIADGVLIKDDFNDDTWLVERATEAAQGLNLWSDVAPGN